MACCVATGHFNQTYSKLLHAIHTWDFEILIQKIPSLILLHVEIFCICQIKIYKSFLPFDSFVIWLLQNLKLHMQHVQF